MLVKPGVNGLQRIKHPPLSTKKKEKEKKKRKRFNRMLYEIVQIVEAHLSSLLLKSRGRAGCSKGHPLAASLELNLGVAADEATTSTTRDAT